MKKVLTILLYVFAPCTLAMRPAYVPIPFETSEVALLDEAVNLIKRYEGWHSEEDYPYVGYGHRLLHGENFGQMTEENADSLLRADLKAKCAIFRRFGKDSLLLGVLAYNVGEYRLLGYGDQPRSHLIRKLENGNRDIRDEYVSFRKWRGRVVPSIERRRVEEFELLYDKTKTINKNNDTTRK